ncbi:MAG: L-rhamnose mutarotase [Candidatus Latescibacteria bacterium]|nr:L-rhamnose mutarotase [Candidatus Latescibacterota bacterium]
MIRKAFVMNVNPDQHEEYEKRHTPIWADLEQTLKDHGVHNYSIFLEPDTHQLFAYVEIEDEERWNAIAQTDPCKRWWAYMKDIMASNPDNSPQSKEIREVFHID